MKSRTALTAVLTVLAACLLASIAAIANDKIEVKGMITSRSGDSMVVKTSGDGQKMVFLSNDTTTKDDRGVFGLEKESLSNSVLIPGLRVDLDATRDEQGRLIATVITVDGDDLETAEMMQAGMNPTAQQVATNVEALETKKKGLAVNSAESRSSQEALAAHAEQIQQNIEDIKKNTERFESLHDYDVKGEVTANFDVGSLTLSSQDQEELKQLAIKAMAMEGYLIEVTGYADSTDVAVMNTRLSEDRAKAVIRYLVQQCGVPIQHIVAPGAMGEYQPSASNETKAGRAQNRKAEVKVLVDKGIAGT